MRLKALNGAPLPQHLNFDEHTLLPLSQCDLFVAVKHVTNLSGDAKTLRWRRLGTKHARLRTGWSQPYLPGSGRLFEQADASISLPEVEQASTILETDTTMDLNEQPTAADDFLQHSLMFHDTLLSSQVAQDTVADQTISSSSFLTTSFGTTASELSGIDGHTLILQLPPRMTITPLGSLPSAQHLRSIYPQTPTIDILCVLMAHPERREVFFPKSGYKMGLYELTVGDDTETGFKITFWLRPPRESNTGQYSVQGMFLQTLERIRIGDILLLRNIALTSFRDTVHGQSLNPAIARARTTVDVLMKHNGVSVGQLGGLPMTIIETFTRVKRWARSHVAATEGSSRKRRRTSVRQDSSEKRQPASPIDDDSLPPDTLEAV